MTKNELNKAWAELEGWQPAKLSPTLYETKEPIEGFVDSTGLCHGELPDWTEPNRFFAEVVSRMRELDCMARIYCDFENTCDFQWIKGIAGYSPIATAINKDIGIAGLTAAIQARKELKCVF